MSEPLPVNILWHLHQPLYRPVGEDEFYLPWVRLHGLREYHDMAEMIERYPETAVTFNWSPVLLQQIDEYNEGYTDRMLQLRDRPAGELSKTEQYQLVRGTFRANPTTMIEPYPELAALHRKWLKDRETAKRNQELSWPKEKIRDCQVWGTLMWFGFSAIELYPELKELREKGEDFSTEAKQRVREVETELLDQLLPRWKKLEQESAIEISVNPYFHPIGPLLCSYSDIEQAMPEVPQPERQINWPEDGRWQLEEAKNMATEKFGLDEVGLWPSEGSLSNCFLEEVNNCGFKWTATAEALLHRINGNNGDKNHSKYRAYSWRGEIPVFFRDTGLSDLIGFDYSQMETENAIGDIFDHFRKIKQNTEGTPDRVLSIILDGENPWEHFLDGGEAFLDQFYSKLAQSNEFRTTTPASFLAKKPELPTVEEMPAGSWISGDFNIWGGCSEDVRAWELLAETREALRGWDDLSEEQLEKCWRALYAAQGSDWFWWYGEPFQSTDDGDFDQLFRNNLLQVYQEAGHPEPSYIHLPLQTTEEAGYEPPRYFIEPEIDGEESHYREWWGAARITTSRSTQAMAKSTDRFETVRFGSNEENIYFSLGFEQPPPPETTFVFSLEDQQFELGPLEDHEGQLRERETKTPIKESNWAYDQLLEARLPMENTELEPGDYCNFQLELVKEGSSFERYPARKKLAIPLLDKKSEAAEWTV